MTIQQRQNQLVGQCLKDDTPAFLWSITVTQVAELFGCSRSYAYRVLQQLIAAGTLKRMDYFWQRGTADLYYFSGSIATMIDDYKMLDKAGTASGVLREKMKGGQDG